VRERMKKIIFYPTIFILIFLSSYILADKNDHGYTIEEQVKSYGKLEIVSSKAWKGLSDSC